MLYPDNNVYPAVDMLEDDSDDRYREEELTLPVSRLRVGDLFKDSGLEERSREEELAFLPSDLGGGNMYGEGGEYRVLREDGPTILRPFMNLLDLFECRERVPTLTPVLVEGNDGS